MLNLPFFITLFCSVMPRELRDRTVLHVFAVPTVRTVPVSNVFLPGRYYCTDRNMVAPSSGNGEQLFNFSN